MRRQLAAATVALCLTPAGIAVAQAIPSAPVVRAMLFDDAVKLSVGRYHTPIGYWNTAFHHGAWLQTTVARPEIIKFGSQLIPTHFVGAFAEGNLPTDEGESQI